ncbi:hypothetical protein [Clostridium massiliamazoniense]|nr:hypothetical protein [Clostridium massiliamazoniense]
MVKSFLLGKKVSITGFKKKMVQELMIIKFLFNILEKMKILN